MILSLNSLNSPTSFKLIGLALCASFMLHSINSSLPTQIEQPLKYRMICAGADFINYFVRFLLSNVSSQVFLIDLL